MCDAIKRLVGASEPLARAVALDFGSNADLDITSAEKLDELVRTLRAGGIDFALAAVRQRVTDTAPRTGVLATIGEDHLFLTIDQAVKALRHQ